MRFYEERISLLRYLEGDELLQAFRVGEETVDAQLPDWRWLSIAQSGLTLNALTSEVDTEETWSIIEAIVGRLGSLQFTRARVSYQYAQPLPMSFDAALEAARNRLYPDIGSADVVVQDWALLADLALAGPSPATGQIELGIAHAWEIPMRLKRTGGRGPGMAHVGEREWVPAEFKEPLVFADSDFVCRATMGQEESFLAQAKQFWIASQIEMSRLVDGFREKLVSEGRQD